MDKSRFLSTIGENPWFAYMAILFLQLKVMLGIWEFRDLTPGDTSSYYLEVFSWLDGGKASIVWSPLYTASLAVLQFFIQNAYWVTIIAQVSIAICGSLLVLALLRRLLPSHIALIMAAWWTMLPINFDTVYSVHLFSALFPILIFVIAVYIPSVYGRGLVLGGLLISAVLVRNEYGALFILWLLTIIGVEFYDRKYKSGSSSYKNYLVAYGLPVLAGLTLIGLFYINSNVQYPKISEDIAAKHTRNVCQIYAYNRIQQGKDWNLDPWTECEKLIMRDFGQPTVTFSQAFSINPGAILEHLWWNIKLIPSGAQLALFNHFSGGPSPDYMLAKESSFVWGPLLLVLGLAVLGLLKHLIVPALKRRPIDNGLVWLLMASTALLVLGIIMMQRPRPSYMFPLSLFIMASTGLGLHTVLEWSRLSSAFRIWCPVAIVLFVLFVPPYYDSDYVSHFGYKGQGLREVYESVAPHVDGAGLTGDDLVVIPAGDYGTICNYLGLTCRSLDGKGNLSADQMRELASANPPDGDVYALYSEAMMGDVSAEFDKRQRRTAGYMKLNCSPMVENALSCGQVSIDLARGFLNDGLIDVPLRTVLFVKDGYVVDKKTFGFDRGYYLQVLMKDEQIDTILMVKEDLFRSKFNQRYLLGKFDRRYFEEVYNDFPEARIFRLLKTPEAQGLPK